MEKKPKDVKADKLKSVSDFVDVVVERTGNEKIGRATIGYHLHKTDKLDWVRISGQIFIVMNKKADDFKPGSYHEGKKRKMNKMKL